MYRIAICDDDKSMVLHIENYIRTYFNELGECVEMSSFYDAESFLGNYEIGMYFIVFLDIDMKPINGLTLAKRIWEIDKKTFIVFETGHEEYSRIAYDVHPFDYIIKPLVKIK